MFARGITLSRNSYTMPSLDSKLDESMSSFSGLASSTLRTHCERGAAAASPCIVVGSVGEPWRISKVMVPYDSPTIFHAWSRRSGLLLVDSNL